MTIRSYHGITPVIGKDCFIAPSAEIIGDVQIGDGTSVWYGAVIRGDIAPIRIGAGCNVQEGCVLHVDNDKPLTIGDHVTIGHAAVVHGSEIGDNCLIGISATMLGECRIGHGSLIAAGAVLTPRTEIPPRSLAMGVPARVVRELPPEIEEERVRHAEFYHELGQEHLRELRAAESACQSTAGDL